MQRYQSQRGYCFAFGYQFSCYTGILQDWYNATKVIIELMFYKLQYKTIQYSLSQLIILPFQYSKEGIYKKLWTRIKQFENEGLPILSFDHNLHLQRTGQEGNKYAYINDVSSSRLVSAKSNCSVSIMPEYFFSLKYAVGMQNNSVYRELINNA